ncbi:MAG: hypothetical protein AAGA75_13710 [Cyanobacteria bacterium P01_E01_bin.6]
MGVLRQHRHHPKTDIVVTVAGGVPIPLRRTAIQRRVEPGTAAFLNACPKKLGYQ